MSEPRAELPAPPRWLHGLAVLTVCAALPLLLLGAEVTTKKVGMVDKEGFRTPWHLFTVSAWQEGVGFVIEHSHRLFGFAVGFCSIVLAVGLWRKDPRRWVRWLGVVALAGVSVQGLLGGFRVQLNALLGPELALVHGCFAQVAFALLVALALVTSRGWLRESARPADPADARALRRWCWLAVAVIYLQIVLGAFVRRTETRFAPRLHLLLAFAVVAVVVLAAREIYARHAGRRLLRRTAGVLLVLLAAQLALGLEAWLTRFHTTSAEGWSEVKPLLASVPRPAAGSGWAGLFQAVFADPGFVRSLHFLAGALLFALAVSATFYAHRGLNLDAARPPAPARRREEAAA